MMYSYGVLLPKVMDIFWVFLVPRNFSHDTYNSYCENDDEYVEHQVFGVISLEQEILQKFHKFR